MAEVSKETVLATVEKTVELLKMGWTQEAYARDKAGKPTSFMYEGKEPATCWCMEGAIMTAARDIVKTDEVYSSPLIEHAYEAIKLFVPQKFHDISKQTGKNVVVLFNDNKETTVDDVLKVAEAAVKYVKAWKEIPQNV